jgi:hypothetical protein
MSDPANEEPSAWRWWNRRRVRYALVLMLAGAIGFVLLACATWATQPYLPIDEQGEVTAFTVVLQAIAFGFLLAVAQVFYTAGPLAEVVFKPRSLGAYRTWMWRLGTLFSIGLILALPVLSAAWAIFVVASASASASASA